MDADHGVRLIAVTSTAMTPMRRCRLAGAVLVALATLATGCATDAVELGRSGDPTVVSTTGPTTTGVVDVSGTQLTAGLVPFTACDQLLTHLRAEAVERVGPYGLGGGWFGGPVMLEMADMGVATTDSAMNAPAAGMARSMEQGVDFSGTNVQELGIDEPDILKTDGRRILVIEDDRLHLVDVTGPTAVLTGSLRLEGHWSRDLLLAGDRAFLIADTYLDEGRSIEPYGDDGGEPAGDGPSPALARLSPPGTWSSLTSVIEVDLSDPTNLRVANVLTVQGRHVSSRVVGGSARIVVVTAPSELPFVYPVSPTGEERAERFNREVVAETVLSDWMPDFVLESDGETLAEGPLNACTDVSRPAEFAGFAALTVLTVPLNRPLSAPATTAVLAEGSTVYAGHENLYVTTNAWIDPEEMADESRVTWWNERWDTAVHQFDVTDPAATTYLASGVVPGHLLNQFSLSEHEGHLRVATTTGGPWRFDEDAQSMVTVLARNEATLDVVGQVGDMGRGERIFAVRYVGDVAYVVTFRQTDPFYTVDLSDPTDPRVRGELKITGYSGYLHPVGDGLVLGIGQDATDTGRTTGAKATLFDVSDLDAPTALGTWSAGGGSTSVEWDHRAFLWWAPEQLAVLPFTDWRSDTNAAVVLRIADGTIIEVGRIDHTPDDTGGPVVFPCPLIDPAEGADMLPRPPGGMTLMLCTDGGHPQVRDHWCEYMNAEEVRRYGMEFGVTGIEVPEGAMVAACFPDDQGWVPPIERTLVIGDDLWSYSRNRVQANDMATLTRLQVVGLG
jgi:uncharacterized secreted protein with C-terminal beta-propeller domain